MIILPILFGFFIVPSLSNVHIKRFESVGIGIYNTFSELWTKSHKSWININRDDISCFVPSKIIFPACQHDSVVHGNVPNFNSDMSCSDIQCFPGGQKACVPTPSDTIDYLPAIPLSTDDDSNICEHEDDESDLLPPFFGLSEGVPPYFTPSPVVRLNISGTIFASFNDRCEVVQGAVVRAWQLDISLLRQYSSTSERLDPINDRGQSRGSLYSSSTSPSPPSLREISCSGKVTTSADGSYSFSTTLPPSYGPPRNVMFSVSLPGFETLTTRMYFDADWRLQQLTEPNAHINFLHKIYAKYRRSNSTSGSSLTPLPDDDTPVLDSMSAFLADQKFNGSITLDPRVATLIFKPANGVNATLDFFSGVPISGHFEAKYNMVLQPVLSSVSGPTPALDLRGLWTERAGGLINVETLDGKFFVATEYPHQRSWGTVVGIVSDDTIRGVDFKSSLGRDATINADANIGQKYVDYHPDSSIEIGFLPDANNNDTISAAASTSVQDYISRVVGGGSSFPGTLWSSAGSSTGVVLPVDPFASAPSSEFRSGEMTIRWSGAEYANLWSRVPPSAAAGYRFFKLQITRETGGYLGGKMVINEIEMYAGVLSQDVVPSAKMRTPRFPAPLMVTCSSYLGTDSHCFKAFDGDSSSGSAWVTAAVGSRRHELAVAQWVLLDLGPGRYALPTAIRIVCGAGEEEPRGCPMTFALLGSHDNMLFEVLTKQDLFDYANDYKNGGKLFTFFWESTAGRPLGRRCGSCETGPDFACALQAFDATCASQYCDVLGVCAPRPICKVGEFLDVSFVGEGKPAMECRLCPAGRFGNLSGSVGGACAGVCAAGYYCIAGSTSPMQQPCGGEDVFCPMGSALPLPVGGGRRSIGPEGAGVGVPGGLVSPNTGSTILFAPVKLDPLTRVADTPCAMGHYCVRGAQLPCPVGRFGSTWGLMTDDCTDGCRPGQYCPPGSASPSICEKGFFCPDGRTRSICPAGTFGASPGLLDRLCSGRCRVGYYCQAGSISSASAICPGGRYGATAGLQDSSCSGPCAAGHYCAPGAVGPQGQSARAKNVSVSCGGPDVYCPAESPLPVPVAGGYYSTGGDETRRQAQTKCELGFYCRGGLKAPCPAGTFGSIEGLAFDNRIGQFATSFPCSGFCLPGYYCPPNSTSATQVPCPPGRYGAIGGLQNATCSAVCPAGHYCPAASVQPIKCRAGIFGNKTGLVGPECANVCWEGGCDSAGGGSLCREGYYCPEGSTVATQRECGGPGVFCPVGSAAPTPASQGFYTVGRQLELGVFDMGNERSMISQLVCEIGSFCIDGVKRQCPPGVFGSSQGLWVRECSGPCPAGFYCPIGTFNATAFRCPAGRYGGVAGLSARACSGPCAPGYYCPEGSTSPKQVQCAAWASQLGAEEAGTGHLDLASAGQTFFAADQTLSNAVFCPAGSSAPLVVLAGYYSSENNRTTRVKQNVCPVGSYCVSGIIRDCPAGRFGRDEKLFSPLCSGPCQLGHYCPPGSTTPTQRPCPLGRYGDREGLSDGGCSGPCSHPLDCPEGSTRSVPLPSSQKSAVW